MQTFQSHGIGRYSGDLMKENENAKLVETWHYEFCQLNIEG